MKIAIMCVVILLGCQLRAQETEERIVGTGVSATETRSLGDFDKVDLQGVGSVKIVLGQTLNLQVTADDNILPLITTEASDGTLLIGMKEKTSISPKVKISVEIQMPTLLALRLSGAGDLTVTEIQGDTLKLELLGAGSITGQGQIDTVSIDVAGAGKVDVSKLDAGEADVRIAGVGDVAVSANKTLAVSIAGVGGVRYSGSPQLTKTIDGIGNVRRDGKESTSSQPKP